MRPRFVEMPCRGPRAVSVMVRVCIPLVMAYRPRAPSLARVVCRPRDAGGGLGASGAGGAGREARCINIVCGHMKWWVRTRAQKSNHCVLIYKKLANTV